VKEPSRQIWWPVKWRPPAIKIDADGRAVGVYASTCDFHFILDDEPADGGVQVLSRPKVSDAEFRARHGLVGSR
jgi:hypothetical protein